LVNGAGGFDASGVEGVARVITGVDGLYEVVFLANKGIEVDGVRFVGSSTKALREGGAGEGVSGWLWKWIFGGHEGG
jgi:hypothetical protein